MGRKSASESGIRDEQPGSYFLKLKPGSGMEKSRIRDPGLTFRIRNTAYKKKF
jgi:hypothetical protein